MTGSPTGTYPQIRQTVLDCPDVRASAEFYRELFGLRYRPGDAVSTYLIDIHKAPDLTRDMLPAVEDLFNFNCPEVVINS